MRRAIIYRENYLKMLESDFSGLNNYEKLVTKIKSFRNPISFYNKIKSTERGELLSDIKFMYDTNEIQKIFNILCEELEIDVEEDDFQVEEGEE